MAKPLCTACGSSAVERWGKMGSGAQRWRCRACGATFTQRIDNAAKRLVEFLRWLLSKARQADMPGGGRTFRRRTSEFWHVWPLPPVTGEVCRVVFVDGIYLARNVVVLIACSEEHVLGWYVARSENSRAYRALMARIAPPDVAVTDGGPGFQKARRELWPETRVQRCTFHAFEQVRRYTTTRPRTQAGVDLYALAKFIRTYMRSYGLDLPERNEEPLFQSHVGGRLTRQGVTYILRKHADAARKAHPDAGIPERLSPHGLRHTAAMEMVGAGVDLIYIRDLLGHASVRTTEVYARADSKLKREAIESSDRAITHPEDPVWEEDEGLREWLSSLGRRR